MKRATFFAVFVSQVLTGLPVTAGSFGFGEPKALYSDALSDTGNDYILYLATNGQSVWVAVWYSHANLNGIGTDSDILFVRSEDNGATWSQRTHLNSNATTDNGNDMVPRIEYAPNGTWLTVWRTQDPSVQGAIGTDADLVWSKSTDNGETWSDIRVLNSHAWTDSGGDYWVRFVYGGNGLWRVFWISAEDLTGNLGTDYDIFWATSLDDAESWSPATSLNASAAGDDGTAYMLDAANGGTSTWIVAWPDSSTRGGTSAGDFDILYVRSENNGTTWTQVAPLHANADSDTGDDGYIPIGPLRYGPSIATDGAGNWIVAWDSRETLGETIGIDPDILYTVSVDDGLSWSAVQPLNTNAATDAELPNANDVNPCLHTDGSGVWLCVWTTGAFSDPLYTDTDIAISRSTDLGETWSDPAPLNTYMATDFEGGDTTSRIRLDGNGGAMVVWTTTSTFFAGTDYDNLFAYSADVSLPPMPPLMASAQDLIDVLIDVILGKKILDRNGDGIVDIADVIIEAMDS